MTGEVLARGHFRLGITRSDEVQILTEADGIVLRLLAPAKRRRWGSPRECVAVDSSGATLDVRQTRRLPHPSFDIAADSTLRATVRCTGLLGTRFRASMADGSTWDIRVPLFSARLQGTSERGGSLVVGAILQSLWDVWVEGEPASAELLVALACIQRARYHS